MAINKDRIVRIINNRAVPANQPLPPSMPGYDQGLCGLRLRPGRAKALLAEAGLADGFSTELYAIEHRSEPAHRPGDPAGSRGDRHQGGDQVARPGERHRGRRQRHRADDLVGRHGAGSPTSPIRPTSTGRSSAAAARCRAAGTGRGTATRSSTSARPRPTPWSTRPRPRSANKLWGDDLRQDHGGRALGAGLQRAALHHAFPRMGGDDSLYVDPVHIPVHYDYVSANDRCASSIATRSTAATITSGGTIRSRPSRGWRRARRSSSSASTPPAARSRQASTVADVAALDFAQGQSGDRADLCRGRGAGRRAEGDDREFRAVRLRLDGATSRASGCSPTSSPSRR